MIVARVAPSEVVVVVRRVIDWTIIKVEIGVTVPWTPTIRRRVSLNDSNFRLPAIGRYFNMLYINLFAPFSDDV